jgi:amino acid transporter
MNRHTGTPVNAVWFCCVIAIFLGLLAFAGDQAIGAIFSLGVVSLNVAYAIPIAARYLFENDCKPGPFSLGRWVSKEATYMR